MPVDFTSMLSSQHGSTNRAAFAAFKRKLGSETLNGVDRMTAYGEFLVAAQRNCVTPIAPRLLTSHTMHRNCLSGSNFYQEILVGCAPRRKLGVTAL